MRKPRKPRVQARSYIDYVARLTGMPPRYTFASLGLPKDPSAFQEFLHVEFRGYLRAPSKRLLAPIKLTLIGDRNLTTPVERTNAYGEPSSVGHLTARSGEVSCLGSLPYDALWAATSAVQSGTFRYISLHGIQRRGGVVAVTSMSFSGDVDHLDLQ